VISSLQNLPPSNFPAALEDRTGFLRAGPVRDGKDTPARDRHRAARATAPAICLHLLEN
jgi:hypothetical protein